MSITTLKFRLQCVVCAVLILCSTLSVPAQESTDALIASLNEKNSHYEAFRSLAALAAKDQRAFDALVTALRDHRDMMRRAWAAQALGTTKDERAVEPLSAAAQNTRDKADNVRVAALEALAEIGTPRAVEALAQVLRDPGGRAKHSAAQGLGIIGTVESLAALDAARNEPTAKPWVEQALKKYDVRDKATKSVDDLEITLIGVERTQEWNDAFTKIRARKGFDIAVVYFRFAARKPLSDVLLQVEMFDAEGNRLPPAQSGFRVTGVYMKATPRFLEEPFAVKIGTQPKMVKIQGAEFVIPNF